MKKNILIFMVFIILLFCVSCNKAQETSENENLQLEDEINKDEKSNEPSKDIDIEIIEDEVDKIVSPLDGLKYDKETLNKRPVVVSIDNHPDARWQSGLSQAEIIYECEVEGSYTRYLCVFLANEPERVGPVRSARPYLVYYALENDGIFVHVGGSQEAFNEIYNLKVPNVDGLYSNAMYRYYKTNKIAPHNMYTTLSNIRYAAENKGYKSTSDFEGYVFNLETTKLSETYDNFKNNVVKADSIKISYNKSNTTDYIYNEEKKMYLRFKDNEAHLDELNKQQLITKNIIIIETSKQVLDSEGRLYLATVGKGQGIYISEGEAINITWEKPSKNERTKFYLNSKELTLNPGNSWIQVVSNLKTVIVK